MRHRANRKEESTAAAARPRGSLAPGVLKPRPRGTSRTSAPIEIAAAVALLAVPWIAGAGYTTSLTGKLLSFALLAVSLDILWGYGGLVSFGQGAVFGVGAYALGAVLQHTSGLAGTYLGLIAAVGVCMLLGLLLGLFIFSGKEVVGGFGFAIVTLAVGLILQLVATAWSGVTGGSNGLFGYADPTIGIPGLEISSGSVWGAYYFTAIAAMLAYLAVRLLLRSDFGLILRATFENEARSDTLGHSVGVYRTAALVVSFGLAGFAGALYLPTGIVTPSQMSLEFSTLAIIWVAIGGRGTLIGPVLGALALGWLQDYLSGELLTLSNLATGILLTLIVLLWPDGLIGAFRGIGRKLRIAK